MRLRINIAFSFFIHAVLISSALVAGFRDAVSRIPEASMIVTLMEDLSSGMEFRQTTGLQDRRSAPLPESFSRPAVPEMHPEHTPLLRDRKPEQTPPFPLTGMPVEPPAPEKSMRAEDEGDKGHTGAAAPSPGKKIPTADGGEHQAFVGGLDARASQGTSRPKAQGGGPQSVAVVEARSTIRAAIEKNLIYPPFAKKRGIEGTAVIEFAINSTGHPEGVRIIRSSGSGILDTAARDTVFKASPFALKDLSIEIPVTFHLKKE